MKKLPNGTVAIAALVMACGAAVADKGTVRLAELADLSLEQLTTITVTSPSRREEKLIEVPASIFVITAEDIRRSGANTLPEALRLAPNLQLARADTSQHVVTARGNISGTANKMLVLIDGRTIYTPLFAGVFWDAQDVMLEDIERVEVISGPGSTLWGANAVNGVINVTTKSAAKTQGALLAVGGGSEERGAAARAGGRIGQDGHYRAFARYFNHAEHRLEAGGPARDASDRWLAGFRGDWESAQRNLTVAAQVSGANVDNLAGSRDLAAGHLLARWVAARSGGSQLMLRAYYDRTEREHANSFREKRDTFDVEVQHAMRDMGPNEVVWGANYRASRDATRNTPTLGFVPTGRTLGLASIFVQDEVALAPHLRATVGLRAERNTYTGVEWLPNLRLAWLARPDHLVWSALTRTVRSPSRIDRDIVSPGMPPYLLVANDTFRSEIANVAEVGYRAQVRPGATLSLTAFHHRFSDLRTLEAGSGGLRFANSGEGRATGLEGWASVMPAREWRVLGGFTLLRERYAIAPGHVDVQGNTLGNDPKRTALLRSSWSPTARHELDVTVRHTGALPAPAVPAHTIVDVRAGWRPTRALEISLRVGNALNRRYAELGTIAQRALFERSVFLKATWTP